jgi:hypothetical protein
MEPGFVKCVQKCVGSDPIGVLEQSAIGMSTKSDSRFTITDFGFLCLIQEV